MVNKKISAEIQVRWVGVHDNSSPTLGLPVLENIDRTTLYHANPETGTFSHHAHITHHNDVLYASWSNHASDEGASGSRALFSISKDRGRHWSDFNELFPPQDVVRRRTEGNEKYSRMLNPNGFAVVGDALYAAGYVSIKKGKFIGRLAREIGPDAEKGPIFWLADTSPEPVHGFERYPNSSDARFAAAAREIKTYLARPENLPSWCSFLGPDGPKRVHGVDGRKVGEPTHSWRLRDGTLMRIFRPGKRGSGLQYVQVSTDGGGSWCEPYPSEFPDAHSRSAAGNLPDGSAYIINNPGKGEIDKAGAGRDPLVLSVAEDGLNFDKHAVIAGCAPGMRYQGVGKNPGYQYPQAVVMDDHLFVAYSVNKEDFEVAVIDSATLSDIKRTKV